MKVLYDHQTFSMQNYGGISRIYVELLKNSSDYTWVEAKLALLLSNNVYLKELEHVKYIDFFPEKSFRSKKQLMINANKLYSIFKLSTTAFDVFHPTYYDPYFLKYLKGKPFVVTVLDLIHERFGDIYKELTGGKLLFERKKVMLEKAAKVIAISECTKRDIIEFFGTDERKIEVIYLGNSLKSPDTNKVEKAVPYEYILFVGNRTTYKNFILL